jgi:hypothetical protein
MAISVANGAQVSDWVLCRTAQASIANMSMSDLHFTGNNRGIDFGDGVAQPHSAERQRSGAKPGRAAARRFDRTAPWL